MAFLKKYAITNKGMDLLRRLQVGDTLRITRVELGEWVADKTRWEEMTRVRAPVLNVPITNIRFTGDERITLRFDIHRAGIERNFYWREIGIYAWDEKNNVEILYMYNNAESTPDYVSKDNTDVKIVTAPVVIGRATNVTAQMDLSGAYTPNVEFESHAYDERNPHHVTKEQLGIVDPPELTQLMEHIGEMEAATGRANAAADELAGVGERVPLEVELEDYAYAVMDEANHLALGIRKDGAVEIQKADTYPVGRNRIQAGNELTAQLAYALLDDGGKISELAVGADGKFPIWVLKRWKQRMNAADAGEVSVRIDAVSAKAAAANGAAEEVGERLDGVSARLPEVAELAGYAYAVVDGDNRLCFAVKKDGSVVIPKADAYPVGRDKIEGHDGIQGDVYYSVVDAHNICSELTIGRDGRIPNWILRRWKERMGGLDTQAQRADKIVCWGDSLTAGAGGNGTNYRTVLQSALDAGGYRYEVVNGGVGGEGALAIAVRQGGQAVVVNGVMIPAGTVPVKIADQTTRLSLSGGGTVALLRQGVALVNPCSIGGIEGIVSIEQESYSAPNYTYYFTRAKPGEAWAVTRPAYLHFDGWNYDDCLSIIWVGTNDTAYMAAQIIAQQEKMVERLTHKRYLVIGLTCKAYHPDVEEKNKSMQERWGRRFFDLRRYLLDYGLADAGLTPAAGDTAAIASGEMPPGLLADAVHFNAAGYTVIGQAIYRRLIEEGYLERSK